MIATSVAVMVVFFKSVIPKVLNHSYYEALDMEIKRHFTIDDFTDVDLLLYASLSLKQA